MAEKVCARCHRVCVSEDEFKNHECFDMDAKIATEIALQILPPPGPSKHILEVGSDGMGNVVVNHPELERDDQGAGYILFSPEQARNFATLLLSKALDAEMERRNV